MAEDHSPENGKTREWEKKGVRGVGGRVPGGRNRELKRFQGDCSLKRVGGTTELTPTRILPTRGVSEKLQSQTTLEFPVGSCWKDVQGWFQLSEGTCFGKSPRHTGSPVNRSGCPVLWFQREESVRGSVRYRSELKVDRKERGSLCLETTLVKKGLGRGVWKMDRLRSRD